MRMAVLPYTDPATGGALLACPDGKPGDHGVVIYLVAAATSPCPWRGRWRPPRC